MSKIRVLTEDDKALFVQKKVVKKHFKQLSSALGNPKMLCQFYNTSLFWAETHLSSNWFQWSIAKWGIQLQKSPGFHRTLLSCLQISSPLKNEISILSSSANFMRWPSLTNSHSWLQILHFRNFEKGTHIAPFFIWSASNAKC